MAVVWVEMCFEVDEKLVTGERIYDEERVTPPTAQVLLTKRLRDVLIFQDSHRFDVQ